MDLIFVHGRDQQGKNPEDLLSEWEKSLEEGWRSLGLSRPANLNIRLPFYGNELDRMIKELEAPLVVEVKTKGGLSDTDEMSFKLALLEDLAHNAGITNTDIQAHYSGQPVEKGPLNWEWVQAILRTLDGTPIGETSIDLFTRDVYVYLTNKAVRREINRIVSAQIPREPCVVVGHSLGTIVIFNVLRELASDAPVKRLVTVGSPLGMNSIQAKLIPPALAMPIGVSDWFNAYDERDVVALCPLDSNSFPISPAVRNWNKVKNQTKNRHGIVGYLNDTEVAAQIYKALTT